MSVFDAELENVAYHKPATQSSTHAGYDSEAVAERAVDGNGDGNIDHHSCAHTADGDSNPWWRVDLQGVYRVHKVSNP